MMIQTPAALPTQVNHSEKLSVVIVDDAVVVRGVTSRWIDAEPDLHVAGTFKNVDDTLSGIVALNPDIILLDIDMPGMNGLDAIPLILKLVPKTTIIMSSTLTRRNAEISMKALQLGAKDYVAKPETTSGLSTADDYKRELFSKIRALAHKSGHVAPAQPAKSSENEKLLVSSKAAASAVPIVNLRAVSKVKPKIILIGSSTGGPQALQVVMPEIAYLCKQYPILITQHMPATFTAILAEHLAKSCGVPVREAKNGDVLKTGEILVAPGGLHMVLSKQNDKTIVLLEDTPPVNFCKPAVDPLFKSAVPIYGNAILSLVLTGMGSDGALGALEIANAGGTVVAQDETTSVVWGMPGATYNARACSAVLPLNEIGKFIKKLTS